MFVFALFWFYLFGWLGWLLFGNFNISHSHFEIYKKLALSSLSRVSDTNRMTRHRHPKLTKRTLGNTFNSQERNDL